MTVLRSYVGGAWTEPTDEGRPVLDAVTGEEVARVSSAGIDLAAALDYGRSSGGPALRELTFHQRAALLKSLGQLLREHRQELYTLSARTGATLGDSRFDIDGGIGVLLSYASRAKRELPNDTILAEGAVEPLGKGGTFVGQHILTPLHGVAVQINAFNFPVWGPLEKFAPAFIAGVPTLVKPATQTAYLTARLVELIVGSGLLPDGAIQLVCGSIGGLFDHLGEQDLVSFTGSAATARQLRAHPAIVGRSIRFNAEADSLNCSILGPEAGPGTPEFDLYVRQLVTEMTVKAGQKCTAIRRALVPAALADQVAEAARDRLATVVVGNPAEEGVRMGALAGLEQREEVRRSVKALLSAGRIVSGDPDHVDVVGASAERGAFMAPLLLQADDAGRPEPHQVEAFGPVSTIIGYQDTAEVIELAARGRGSLAGSIVTADAAFARDVVLGLAPWHGRLLVLDREDGAESTGHGSPLPMLVHGGPGGPAAARRWAASAACCTTCSARRCRPARGCCRPSPAAGSRVPNGLPMAATPSASRSPTCASATRWSPGRVRSRWPTSSTSPSSPGTPSTRTWTRRPRGPTRSSTAGWRTATSSSPSRPGCSSSPIPVPCWPTTAWRTCVSSRRSTRETS